MSHFTKRGFLGSHSNSFEITAAVGLLLLALFLTFMIWLTLKYRKKWINARPPTYTSCTVSNVLLSLYTREAYRANRPCPIYNNKHAEEYEPLPRYQDAVRASQAWTIHPNSPPCPYKLNSIHVHCE